MLQQLLLLLLCALKSLHGPAHGVANGDLGLLWRVVCAYVMLQFSVGSLWEVGKQLEGLRGMNEYLECWVLVQGSHGFDTP